MTSAIGPNCTQALVSRIITISMSAKSAASTPAPIVSIRRAGSMNAMFGGVAWPLTIRTFFPSASSTPAMPSSLPKASQSGRMWLTNRNR